MKQSNPADFQCFGRENVVVYATSRAISFSEHTAPLSIKATLKGIEYYEVDGVPIAVDDQAYLVLNHNQPYSSFISSREDVKSFCMFFSDETVHDVSAARNLSQGDLLDSSGRRSDSPVTSFYQMRRHDPEMFRRLSILHAGILEGIFTQLWLDEQFNELMKLLLKTHGCIVKEIERLPFVRSSTRNEIYRRLHRAKDYLDSCFAEPITLSQVSKIACLSPHHFLRLFKETFRLTPHRYLTDFRLRRACHLLAATDSRVTDICRTVGFENESSFTRLFHRRFGCSPLAMRSGRRK
jgi:AraC-like DNA-binding protein